VIQNSNVAELSEAVRHLLRATDAEKYAAALKGIAQN
jgi:hypothetical protein